MARVVVAKAGEIPPGERKLVVPFKGKAGIGVFNIDGEYVALRNLCPHKLGPLCTGHLGADARADAPPSVQEHGIELEREGEILRCPWHMWPFAVRTGQCLTVPDVTVPTYAVKVEGEEIVVEYND